MGVASGKLVLVAIVNKTLKVNLVLEI